MSPTRRDFLISSGAALGAAAMSQDGLSLPPRLRRLPRGRAESCIFIWLGGGACQVDMWDPKRRGDPSRRVAGSAYDAIPTAVRDVHVTEHLRHCAPLMDRMVLLRTVHHPLDEHAAATNRMHTGRPTSGTITYPSIGSIVAHERGPQNENVPAYVVIGYPNVTRGPGFLGSRYGFVYLTETNAGPNGLTRPAGIDANRQSRRQALLQRATNLQLQANENDQSLQEYADVSRQGFQLAGPDFMRVFNLDQEPITLREQYGSEFGQRCLLARRLVQSGVRFIEVSFNLNFVNGTGWDTHNEGQVNQHLLIRDLDQSLSTLILDLERRRLLDTTLIVIATEFGRPPQFDGGGGRGHQPRGFTVVLAGGGMRTGQVIGQTNEIGDHIAERPISVPDMHATIHHAMGINTRRDLFTAESRPVPITDGGEPIAELFTSNSDNS